MFEMRLCYIERIFGNNAVNTQAIRQCAELLYTAIYDDKEFIKNMKDYEHYNLQSLTVSKEYFGLDFSLIVKILIRFPLLIGGRPTRGWGKNKPYPNDVKLADDVQRLRQWRNHFMHKVKGNTDVADFEIFFNDVEAVCGRIDVYLKTSGDNSFRTKIHNLRQNGLTMEIAKQVEQDYEFTKRLSEECIIWRKDGELYVYTSPTFDEFLQQFKNGRFSGENINMTLTFEDCNNPEVAKNLEKTKETINRKLPPGVKIEYIRMGCLEIQLTVSDLLVFKNGSLKNVVTAVLDQLDTVAKIQEWLILQNVVVVSVDDDEHILASEQSHSLLQVDVVFDRNSFKTTKNFESLLKELFQQMRTEVDEEEELLSDLHVQASLQRKPAAYQERRDELKYIYDCVLKLLDRYEYKQFFEHTQINTDVKAVSTMYPTLMRTFDIVLIGQNNDAICSLIRVLTDQELVLKSTLSTEFITRIIDSNEVSITTRGWNEVIISTEEFKTFEDLRISMEQRSEFSEDVLFLDVCYPFSGMKKESITIVIVSDAVESTKLQRGLQSISENAVSVAIFIDWDSDKQQLSDNMDSFLQIRTKMKDANILEAVFLSQLCASCYCDQNLSFYFDDREIGWERPLKWVHNFPKLPPQNIFKIPLYQVKNGKVVQPNNEFFRFKYMLRKNIEKSQEELLKKGCRIIQMFCQNPLVTAQTQMTNLEHFEEKERQLMKNKEEIKRLRTFCEERKTEMDKLKLAIVEELATELHKYLYSNIGIDEILNPAAVREIEKLPFQQMLEEVKRRIENGIRNWCYNEAKQILKYAEFKIHELVEEVNSQCDVITEETPTAASNLTSALIGVGVVFAQRSLGVTNVLSVFVAPLLYFYQLLTGESGVRSRARDQYRDAISEIKLSRLKQGFEQSFGEHFDNLMRDILEKKVSKKINDLTIINNEQLAREIRTMTIERALAISLKKDIDEIRELLRIFIVPQ